MSEILYTISHYIKTITFQDILDIIIAAYLVYQVLKIIRGTSVESVIKGIVVLVILQYLSYFAGLNVINYVIKNVTQLGLIAILIMFQPELRKMLESLGRRNITQLLKREDKETDVRVMIREVVDACSSMSWSRTGALIVFERDSPLNEIITAATELDAKVSSELIKNLFFIKAPLHDGAMVIGADRIKAAGCVLPLTENEELPKDMGTRHRAGIGITESTDAVAVIVSEESGIISFAVKGAIKRNLSPEALENILIYELIEARVESEVVTKTRNLFDWRKGRGK